MCCLIWRPPSLSSERSLDSFDCELHPSSHPVLPSSLRSAHRSISRHQCWVVSLAASDLAFKRSSALMQLTQWREISSLLVLVYSQDSCQTQAPVVVRGYRHCCSQPRRISLASSSAFTTISVCGSQRSGIWLSNTGWTGDLELVLALAPAGGKAASSADDDNVAVVGREYDTLAASAMAYAPALISSLVKADERRRLCPSAPDMAFWSTKSMHRARTRQPMFQPKTSTRYQD